MPGSSFSGKYKELAIEFSIGRARGTLHSVKSEGYGFIKMGDNNETVFVHMSQFMKKISNVEFEKLEGSMLSFIVERTERGSEARRVRVIRN